MFNIVVFLFVVAANGVPSEQSIGSMRSRMQFPSEEVCQAFLASEHGTAVKALVTESEAVKTNNVAVEFRCMNMGNPT